MKVTFTKDSLPALLRELFISPQAISSYDDIARDVESLAGALGKDIGSLDDSAYQTLSGRKWRPLQLQGQIDELRQYVDPETILPLNTISNFPVKTFLGNSRGGLIGGVHSLDIERAVGLEFGPRGAGDPVMMGLGDMLERGFPAQLPTSDAVYKLGPSVHKPAWELSGVPSKPVRPGPHGDLLVASPEIPGPEAINAAGNRDIADGLVNAINWGATPKTIMGSPFPRAALADRASRNITADALASRSPYPSQESTALERLLHDAGYRARVYEDPAEAAYQLHSRLYDIDPYDAAKFMGTREVPLAQGLADILHPPARPYLHHEKTIRRYMPSQSRASSTFLAKSQHNTPDEIERLLEALREMFDRASAAHPATHPLQTREAALAMLAHARSPNPLKGLPPLVNDLKQVGDFSGKTVLPSDIADAANIPPGWYGEGIIAGLPVRQTMYQGFPLVTPRSIWDPVGLA